MTTTTTRSNGTVEAVTHGPAGTKIKLSHITDWTSGVVGQGGGISVELGSDLLTNTADDDHLVALAALAQGF